MQRNITDLSFEEAMEELESVVRQLETGKIKLDDVCTAGCNVNSGICFRSIYAGAGICFICKCYSRILIKEGIYELDNY